MAGHNKWTQIKRKKAITDGKRSKIFSKFSRLITLESKKAGGNVNSPTLKAVIERAKASNMPNENITRAVKKGAENDSTPLEAVTYEAYGPGGVALIIEGLTDNRNKASGEIKHILSKHGGSLGAQGSASWAFTKEGSEWKPNIPVQPDEAALKTLVTLIDELEDTDAVQDVFTNAEFPENFEE